MHYLGLILSKGGPFIHLCALVAHFMCKLPLFALIDAVSPPLSYIFYSA